MLYWMVSKTDCPLTEKQLIHAIRRNFDGLDEFDATEIFIRNVDSKTLVKQSATSDPSKENKIHFVIVTENKLVSFKVRNLYITR